MPPKTIASKSRKSSKGASSSAPPPPGLHLQDVNRFSCEKAVKAYEQILSARSGFIPERGIIASSVYARKLFQRALDNGWEVVLAHPEAGYRELTREFYANAAVNHSEDKVFVRGKTVPFDSKSINAIYSLPDFTVEEDDYHRFIGGDVDLEDVLTVLCKIDKRQWIPDSDSHILSQASLTPAANLWLHFASTRLWPTTHLHSIPLYRSLAMYAILGNYKIDIGRLINKAIKECIKSSFKLWFPSLISDLCAGANVPFNTAEEKIKRQTGINDKSLAQITKEPYVTQKTKRPVYPRGHQSVPSDESAGDEPQPQQQEPAQQTQQQQFVEEHPLPPSPSFIQVTTQPPTPDTLQLLQDLLQGQRDLLQGQRNLLLGQQQLSQDLRAVESRLSSVEARIALTRQDDGDTDSDSDSDSPPAYI